MESALRIAGSFAGVLVPLTLVAAPASGQITFSIDYGSPTLSMSDSLRGIPITEGDLLSTGMFGALVGPSTTRPWDLVPGGGAPFGLGLPRYGACAGNPAGWPCGIEVDAHSQGYDWVGMQNLTWWFSVDPFAVGLVPAVAPDVVSEGAGMGGALDAAADVFVTVAALGLGPIPPTAPPRPNVMAIDGNGFYSASGFAAPGLSLIEWTPPAPPMPARLGDNLDSLDLDYQPSATSIYFSLDSGFPDPLTGAPNSWSAILNGGFVGGDVLQSQFGLQPVLYAPAAMLGLDLLGPPDSDDLDALVLWENGVPGFQPSQFPYDWTVAPQTDCLLFSVRRGSRVIGAPDSMFGVPIAEGDILAPPYPTGVSPYPYIFIPAEALGLRSPRSAPGPFGDDLDALDVEPQQTMFDWNGNFIEDAIEIATGATPDCNANGVPDSYDITGFFAVSWDANGNTIPDECEFAPHPTYCTAKVNSQGCTPTIGAFGTASVTSTLPFFVSAVDVVSGKQGILYYGYAAGAAPWKGGTKCVSGPTRRTPIQNSGGAYPPNNCSGVFMLDFNARVQSGIDPMLVAGATVYGQYWHRDPMSSFTVGLSDGIAITIGP